MDGELKVLRKLNKYEFAVELKVMREGVNENKWNYHNLEQHWETFVAQPILCAFTPFSVGDGHNMTEKVDRETGEEYYSFTSATSERIVGTLSEDPNDFRIEEIDGYKWLIAKGRLFAFYAKELVDEIVRVGRMSVSAETEVFESEVDGDVENFYRWTGLGVTVLGRNVNPAIPGANIDQVRLAALKTELNNIKLKAASLIEHGNEIDENETNEVADNKLIERGMTTLKSLTKKQIAELSERFEGYKVLNAAENEAHNIFVALMSEDGTVTATYRMDSLESTIVPENIAKFNAQIEFRFNEDGEEEDECLCVDATDMTADLCDKLNESNCNLEAVNTALNEAKSRIEAMTAAENARRVKEAKSVANSTLSAFNANRDEKIEAKSIDSIVTDIESGIYTNSVNAQGEWVGAESVKNAVLAVCGAKVMEMDEARAKQNRSQYVWQRDTQSASHDDGTLAGMMAELGL